MKKDLIYSSKQVDRDVLCYSHEDEKYFEAERLAAQMLIRTRKERLKIRDYNNRFNSEESYHKLS